MVPTFLTEKVDMSRLEVGLCVLVGMTATQLITYWLQPRLFAHQAAKGNFGWAEFFAGGTLSEHDRLWPNAR
jgi:predicted secreted Zn-dependent protease